MKVALYAAASAAALVASPAAAAGFAGPRVEGRIGYERVTLDLTLDDGIDHFHDSGHKSGVLLGGEIGYDAAIGTNAIIGAYAGIEGASTKKCGEVYGDDEACLKVGRNLTVGGRVGGVMGGKFMIYGKAGYSNGQLRATYRDFLDPTNNISEHTNRGGFHFGAGVEGQISSNAYARLEYVRTNYSGETFNDPDFDITLDGHRDQLILGFGARF